MKHFVRCCWLLAVVVWVAGCSTPQPQVTQICTIDALMNGVYDGSITVAEFRKHGNLGIGTLHALDGEMLMIDNQVYQVKADGKVYLPAQAATIPFASACNFYPEFHAQLTNIASLTAFEDEADKMVRNPNALVAIHLRGNFKSVKTRSVPAQTKPYPKLLEVTKNQSEFELHDVSGEIVGFRLPPYVKGINVPGWHLHFIDDNRTCGGHLLNFELTSGVMELQEFYDFRMILPQDSEYFATIDLSKDLSKDLKQVESKRD